MNPGAMRFARYIAFIPICILSWIGCAQTPRSPSVPAAVAGRVAPLPPERAYQTSDPDHVTIAIVAINDFHGHVMPKERKLLDGRKIQSGGAPVFTSMLKILREEMKGNLLLVDAGDEWQGTLESNQVQGSIVMDYFNRIGLNVATLGNHEFDFGMQNLYERVLSAKFPYVTANIFEKKTGRRVGADLGWKNVYPSKVFEVAGIKIGVLGLATQETPSTTRYDVVAPYEFRNPTRLIEQEAKVLRKQGAAAVLVTAHAGSKCAKSDDLMDWKVWTADKNADQCSEETEINKIFSKLPKSTLDGAIIGHTHQVVHHWIHGVPSVEGEAFNQYFNILYLTFDRKSGRLIKDETRIEGLIPICSEVFENAFHCDTRRIPDGLSLGLEAAWFHGKKVIPDAETQAWLVPILKSTDQFRKEVIAMAEHPVLHPPYSESMFGNLVSDALRDQAKSDFALVNERGIRASLDAGAITADALYRALPYDNLLNVLKLTGKELKLLFRIANSGTHQFASSSGLRVKLLAPEWDAPKTDLNRDGKLEAWETNRLIELTKVDGSPLDDKHEYTLATYDFLVNGGDNLSWFMSQIPSGRISRAGSGFGRDIVSDYLKKLKEVNTDEHPLIDPLHPRVVLSR